MTIAPEKRRELVSEYRRHEGDSGSPEVQVSILTERIGGVSDHLKINRHDHAARRGLTLMVGKRNRLLKYLQRVNREAYHGLIRRLGLRK